MWLKLTAPISAFVPEQGSNKGVFTLLRKLENGRPRSRANDHIMRDDVATNPMVAQKASAMTMDAMAVVPLKEPVA